MVLKRDRVFLLIVFTMVMLVLTACGGESQSSNAEEVDAEQSQEGTEEWPEQLTIGVVPSEDQTTVSDRVQNFADELSEHLDMDVEVFLGTDYNAVVEAMRTENIDIAFFGPFAYVLANERSGAEVFSVGAENEEDVTYTSVVIVPKDSEAESVEDLKGKDFLFVDPASTSGHIFPRVKIMEELDVTNDEVESVFNNVTFSGSHDASILAIANGDADGAAVATDVMDAMLDQGVVKEDDFKIISESDPIPRGPDAYRSNLPDDLKEEIREFYYDYEDEKFFEERGINGFYPIEDEAYDVVRDAADALGMSPEELLE
ncbi:MAG TPA: phosphate/phosphite/phosphonate ABC transporter substrate-binding protein [Bacillota bacterium]|nr:phosphate/phosphite/phosphonate ABC transporter substrate-binding protein [Bacillota bacterium]